MRDIATDTQEDDMKITLNIETSDPADLERIAAALAGKDVAVTTGKSSAAKAASAVTASKAASDLAPARAETANQDAGAAQTQSRSEASADAAVPSDADLIAAANAATGKVGVGGPDKVKSYIAANFKKADGSPGTLKTTAEGERAKLLLALQQIGRGEITL